MKKVRSLIITFLIGTTTLSIAQSYLVDNNSSTISILGTSTLHDWKIKADTINGNAELEMSGQELKDITSLTINVPVASMHSGLDPMDVHMRTALMANETNAVDFKLLKVTKLTPNTIGGYTVQADAEISIIKNVKSVRLQATMELKENGEIRFFGETMIDMIDYSIELPQAEMGSIKSEKDVRVVFDVILKKN